MVGAVFVLSVMSLHAAEAGPGLAAFKKEIKPLLNKYCVSCHGPEKSKANLRIDELDPDLLAGADGDLWEEVYNQLNIGDMPPEDEEQPTAAEREKISAWVHGQIHHAAEVKRSTGGRNVLRRLTAYEYRNTLRDLLGIDLDFAKSLPPEAAAVDGFVNNYEVLGTSSLHVEYFYEIAKDALERALVFGEKPRIRLHDRNAAETEAGVKQYRLDKEKEAAELISSGKKKTVHWLNRVPKTALRKGEAVEGGVLLSSNGGMFVHVVPPTKKRERLSGIGPLRVTVRAAASNVSRDLLPHMEVKVGYYGQNVKSRPVKSIGSVRLQSGGVRDYVFDIIADDYPIKLLHPLSKQVVEVHNIMGSGTSKLTDEQLPKLYVESVRVEGPYYPEWPPETRTRITGVTQHPEGSADAVREILSHFMTRAYRRPVAPDEINRMLKLYQTLRGKDAGYEEALVDTLAMVLSSPGFLLLAEPAPVDGKPNAPRELNGYEIASRLSYFLWSTMPDAELLALAAEGKLSDKKVLAAQVKRMLENPRAEEFMSNFTRQWLGLDDISTVAVNPEFFPDFEEAMKDVLVEETVATFAYLVSDNRSCLELIDSKEVVVNSKLAAYYGIPGVAGKHFRPVALGPDSQRGGLLSQASVLTLNSSGDDTHPIKRGVWVLERLLGDPPPPPPPGVPPLEEDGNEGQALSLRKRMEAHRRQEACNTCHRKIDPWGVAFENFNGVGVWRKSAKAPKPDAAGGKRSFPAKGARAPQFTIPKGASAEVATLTRAVNKALKSLNQTHESIRQRGLEGKLNDLRRLLVIADSHQRAVEDAIDKLLHVTGEDRTQLLKKFRSANAEALTFNRATRIAAEAMLEAAVNPQTELADGTPIADLNALKTYILKEKRDPFAENFVRKLMGYALGRHLDFADRKTVEALTAEFAGNNYKPRELITNIVLSDVFLSK